MTHTNKALTRDELIAIEGGIYKYLHSLQVK